MTSASNLSIVILTFNRDGYLKNTIESAVAKTVTDEVVVGPGSSDDN